VSQPGGKKAVCRVRNLTPTKSEESHLANPGSERARPSPPRILNSVPLPRRFVLTGKASERERERRSTFSSSLLPFAVQAPSLLFGNSFPAFSSTLVRSSFSFLLPAPPVPLLLLDPATVPYREKEREREPKVPNCRSCSSRSELNTVCPAASLSVFPL
jgi:hypothetical protein